MSRPRYTFTTRDLLQMAASKRPMIAGLMLFLYGLAMWSIWYIRPGDWVGGEALAGLDVDAEYPDVGG